MTLQAIQPRTRLAWYAITIFLSSAVLLVLEITAGRLIAPYVGVSIYSWTSIIGVILAGLSLGNWLGGRWADRGGNEAGCGVVLALSGAFSLFSLLALTLVAPWIQHSPLDLISASFLYVLSMFFIPSVLLGIPTPLLTTLALQLDTRAGHIVGRMHALAALGSIIGTFLTGFVLIQYLGSRVVIIGCAVLLWLLAIPFLFALRKRAGLIVLGVTIAIAGLTYWRGGFASPCDKESNYFCLRVVDVSDELQVDEARALILDHLLHGINHASEPDRLISPYVHAMDELVIAHFDKERQARLNYFFVGGGSYTQPRAILKSTPSAKVTVAELDSAVTELVQQKMYVDTTAMRVIHRDARSVLNRIGNERFDVVITDAFHDIAIPYHLVTREFAALVRSHLHDDGLYTMNVVDAYPDPLMVKSLIKTLQQEFRYVDVWVDQIPQLPQRMTFVISASNNRSQPDTIDASRGYDRSWYRFNSLLLSSGTPLDQLPVFSDDFVPVERMIAGLLLSPDSR